MFAIESSPRPVLTQISCKVCARSKLGCGMEVRMTKGSFATFAVLLALFVGCTNHAPTVPLTPAADIHNDSLSFFTTSTDPSNLKVSYVFSWGNGDSTVTGLVPSGDTVWCSRVFTDTGTFRIKAKARNEKDRESKWSPECVFRASHPPQLEDTIVGPVQWAVDHWYYVSARVSDPDGDSVALKFIWSDSTPSGWTAFVPSGGVVMDSFKFAAVGQRLARVVLKDKGSMTSLAGQQKTVNINDLAMLWNTDDSGCGSYFSPTVGLLDGQTVMYTAAEDVLRCLNAEGLTRWANIDPALQTLYAPSLSNDGAHLYVADAERGLYCYDSRTGSVVWHLDSIGEAACTPVVGPEGTVYIVGENPEGKLYKVRDLGSSPSVEWSLGLGYYPFASLTLSRSGTVYCWYCTHGESLSTVCAVDTDGQILWKDTSHLSLHNESRPLAAIDSRDRVILGDGSDLLYCFNPDGTVAWSTSVGHYYPGGVTIGYADRIFLQDYNGRVLCYNSDGALEWTQSNPNSHGGINNVCAVSDSSVLVYSPSDWLLYCLDRDGNLAWEYSISDSLSPGPQESHRLDEGYDGYASPVLGPDGNIYLAGPECLYGVAWHGRQIAATSWPTYNHDPAHSGWAGRPRQ